ncbi:hypothetical protein HGM15179_004789 [Zosterops borbonicus]|uniref:Uncharacterized protein n=1 Tax=Zosterops borbonicus TaxID=364589 RepID=A0A8K1GQN0_9PASS|nr:hypothetical protein HGM15179_004789 [Zosterops borbonicus]
MIWNWEEWLMHQSCVVIQRGLDRLEECDRILMMSSQGIWQVLALGRSSPMYCYRLGLTPERPKMTKSHQLTNCPCGRGDHPHLELVPIEAFQVEPDPNAGQDQENAKTKDEQITRSEPMSSAALQRNHN